MIDRRKTTTPRQIYLWSFYYDFLLHFIENNRTNRLNVEDIIRMLLGGM
jgi:hypothetical protein